MKHIGFLVRGMIYLIFTAAIGVVATLPQILWVEMNNSAYLYIYILYFFGAAYFFGYYVHSDDK